MKTLLEIGERLALTSLLPKEGNFLTLRIVKSITEKVNLKDAEIKEWNVKAGESSPGVTTFSWSQDTNTETEIEFSEAETDLLRKELNKLDHQNKLTFSNISAFEKFCSK